ncbi:MAG: DEAD/DEAH box helicase [Myxococcota bacterium]
MVDASSARRLTLAGACAGAFTERTRRKARAHVENGEASIEGASGSTVLVFVRDQRSKPYLTAVDYSEVENRERVQVECSCPYFKDGYPCAHIYAALIATDASGLDLVSHNALMGRLDVVQYSSGLPADDDWFFEGENGFASREIAKKFFEDHGGNREPDWRGSLQKLQKSLLATGPTTEQLLNERPIDRIELRIHPEKSEDRGTLVVEMYERIPDPEHPSGRLTPLYITRRDLARCSKGGDRRALDLLLAHPMAAGLIRPSDPGLAPVSSHLAIVPAALHDLMLGALVETAAFRCPVDEEGLRTTPPLGIDAGPPWSFSVLVSDVVKGILHREVEGQREERDVSEALVVIRDGLVLFESELGRLNIGEEHDWLKFFRRNGELAFSDERLRELLSEMGQIGHLPRLELRHRDLEVAHPEPKTHVMIHEVDPKARAVPVDVSFDYDGTGFRLEDSRSAALDRNRFILRDREAERNAIRRLGQCGLRREEGLEPHQLSLKPSEVTPAIRAMSQAGIEVRARGRAVRGLTGQSFRISSGMDWFDLQGEVDFEGIKVPLPELLTAVREREGLVRLSDGSEGLLPDAWVRRIDALNRLSQKKGGQLRFASGQALLLDALVRAADIELEVDDRYARRQAELSGTRQVEAQHEPDGFEGELRPYQREGLGWLEFLDRLGLGGCLADDMGLGKTVQVLALLLARALSGRQNGPTLLVAPRSLVYNWLRESERFAPSLKVLDYTGTQRADSFDAMDAHDLVVTTYGTVRRDVDLLRERTFDYVILDEAQAIKNPSAQSSKACRVLKSRHRLALSGTPIENDAIELWSIFEFLNPRMLGSRQQFHALSRAGGSLPLVAKGLKPLLLRRTKQQVLADLPEKTELSIHCELGPTQREHYERLRDHYRHSIKEKVEQEGLGKSRMHVLEALLRLRQAACHIGLVDPKKSKETSSKIESLMDHVHEVLAGGHKALIFSQFVKLLQIVRERLDEEQLPYAYLDGQTTRREEQVQRFMESEDVGLFLISLKAGGLGLNLTAADYVFILDPWWNPAVEAQAIDRAHRIGQTRPVFAYRFVARDTVEEKIIELHAHKRKLADALVSADDQFLKDLTLEDLRHLFGA